MNYRKIWEKYYQACLLPGIHIHHIDGNHSNNDIKNLKPVTVQEHFNIHYQQGDYFECYLLSTQHLDLSYEERQELSRKNAKKQTDNNVHPFQNKNLQLKNSLKQNDLMLKGQHPFQAAHIKEALILKRQEMLKNHTHTFTNPEIRKKQLLGLKKAASEGRLYSQAHKEKMKKVNSIRQKQRALNGTLNLLDPEFRKKTSERMKRTVAEQIKNGTHHSQITHCCPHCGKVGKGAAMKRYHFDRCKLFNSDLILSK